MSHEPKLPKSFAPAEAEERIYNAWEQSGGFASANRAGAESFTIVIPPPNVTGSLHIGHALNNTLQDILVRFERLRGKNVLWQPGTDHAGIATQMVVERQLAAVQESRTAMGREKFLEKVWDWKAESGGAIVRQLRRLGASCDWSRERFTMDEGFSAAVLKVFVDLYRQGLIYKDKRLVNWDPQLKTAISDLEVEQRDMKGSFWHFRYPVEGQEGRYLVVATTRPETMLGDTAVAVHPDDERYRDLVGKFVILPIVGRRIPVVADEYADPEKGSGAVKITPAHDFNDFQVGARHNLDRINIFDENAAMNENAPADYRGLDRFEARKKVVVAMEELDLLEKVEDIQNTVPYGDRSGVVIEPWLTDQWYVDAATLAAPALAAVETGETKIIPKQWEKTYFQWLRNIEPWCISRQLWWGHRIPAWYAPDGSVFVAETEQDAAAQAREKFGADVELHRDEDVLDTWFSSALWPFGTLGWPETTPELAAHYPNSVLVTGFDILFFWVARMMMMGIHFMGRPPFPAVYLHGLVRDERGQKMSKSKGNVIDPLSLIDEFGADALRFTLAAMETQGRDIKLSKQRIEGYRNFGTKLWNAARFCEMNACLEAGDFDPAAAMQTLNRWILSETARAAADVTRQLEAYRFSDAAGAIYQFVWGTYCDWYLEFIKPVLNGEDGPAKRETQKTAAFVLDRILVLLHPFMPFVTEELWGLLAARKTPLIRADWPGDLVNDPAAQEEINWLIRLVSDIRGRRISVNVPVAAKLTLTLQSGGAGVAERLEKYAALIQRMGRIETISRVPAATAAGSLQITHDDALYVLPVAEFIDVAKELATLNKNRDKTLKEIAAIEGRLNSPQFLAKAPEAVVEENKEKLAELKSVREGLDVAIASIQ